MSWTFNLPDTFYVYDFEKTDLTERAIIFAHNAHEAMGQRRKYTNEHYIVHCLEVADLVFAAERDQEMVCAALLHDVLEDTKVTAKKLRKEFGDDITSLVLQLTDVSKPTDGNRTKRKQIDLEHTAQASARAKTIKLADLISNTRSIVEGDPDFAIVYLKEKERLLKVLVDGNSALYKQASDALIQSKLKLMEKK